MKWARALWCLHKLVHWEGKISQILYTLNCQYLGDETLKMVPNTQDWSSRANLE